MIKFFLLIIFIYAGFSVSHSAFPMNDPTNLYENSIVRLSRQTFFREHSGFVHIDFDIKNQNLVQLFTNRYFQLVRHDSAEKPFLSPINWSALLRASEDKFTVPIPLKECVDREYELYMAFIPPQQNHPIGSPELLCKIVIKTEPKSIGDALTKISHYELGEMNKNLKIYQERYGTKWSIVKLPSEIPHSENDKEYVLDSIIGRGQDGTVAKMIPANDPTGKAIALKMWRDLSIYKFEDATDTWKIKNEINMRRMVPSEICVPLLCNKELKVSGVRALAMPFVKGKTLREILDSQELLENLEDLTSENIIIEENDLKGSYQVKLIDFAKGFRESGFDRGKERVHQIITAIRNKHELQPQTLFSNFSLI